MHVYCGYVAVLSIMHTLHTSSQTEHCVHISLSVTISRHYVIIVYNINADDRFIMKHIKSIEISSFEQFAPHYLEHVNRALEEKVGLNLQ